MVNTVVVEQSMSPEALSLVLMSTTKTTVLTLVEQSGCPLAILLVLMSTTQTTVLTMVE